MGDYDMAAKKKTATRKASLKPLKPKEVRKLLKKARDELAELLQQQEDQELTDLELDTGLEEVTEQLQHIMAHKKSAL
jgi:hypothetical protein